MNIQENNNMPLVVEEENFNFAKLISLTLSHWKLFVVCMVLCLVGACVKLYFTVPQYNVAAKILLADKNKGSFSSQADMLADFGYRGVNSSIENEMEVIKSFSVARGAVYSSGVYISYKKLGVKDIPIYKKASPVNVSATSDVLANMAAPINIYFLFEEGSPVKVRYDYIEENPEVYTEISAFPYSLKTPVGDILVEDMRTEMNAGAESLQGEYLVTINKPETTARGYMSRISINPVSESSSVAVLSITTPVPAEGVDYLNALIESYNNVTNDDKHLVGRQTEDFINSRLDLLRQELSEKEGNLAQYKKDNIDISLDAPQVMQNKSAYIKQLEDVDMMLNASKYLSGFVNDPANDMKLIPTTFGMAIDNSLAEIINNYNKEVVERNQLLLTATEDNPILKNSTIRVKAMQDELRAALVTFEKSLAVQRDAIMLLVDNYTDRFEMSPDIERELLALTRECNIKSDLYVMLLQKYEENALSLAIAADNLRCIDAPTVGGIVSPDKNRIILIALFIGLAIPVIYVCLLMMFQTKLTSVEDTAKMFSVPLVGTIPLLGNLKERALSIVVNKNTNNLVTESFRSLRTNLQFVMKNTDGKVVMFTSSSSGEGKTFIASNMAVSVALLGKKVLLVGGDIRRPRLSEVFSIESNVEALTSYLAADVKEVAILDKAIIKSNVVEGLDLLPAGIVPPNPAELLAGVNLEHAFDYLKSKYDYIIMDSAPVGLVSDSLIASRVADAVVYVFRLDYSHSEDVAFLNSLIAEGKLKNVSVVINGDNQKMARRGSRRYTAYGYGYGYGYGYSDDKK